MWFDVMVLGHTWSYIWHGSQVIVTELSKAVTASFGVLWTQSTSLLQAPSGRKASDTIHTTCTGSCFEDLGHKLEGQNQNVMETTY